MATHTRLSGSASRQASPSARNKEETRYYTQIPRCSGLDSHNEQTPALKVPLQTELWFHSHGYEQPPHRRACGTTNSGWLTAGHCSSVNDLRLGRQDSCSDGLRANVLLEVPRPPPHTRGEDKPPRPKSRRSDRRWRRRSRRRRSLLWLPPPQHRRRQPPAYQHRTSERRPPQSASAGPHSRPRRKNENGTVSEHEYRPRGVRRVVRPSGATGHSRPNRGWNAAPWPGSSSSPSPAWLEDASSAELEDGFHP
jgi:hypothetical protein